MLSIYRCLWLGLFSWLFTKLSLAKDKNHPTYTNRWAVNIEGGEEVAQRVARQLGFTYKGQVKWVSQQRLSKMVYKDLRHGQSFNMKKDKSEEVITKMEKRAKNFHYELRDFFSDMFGSLIGQTRTKHFSTRLAPHSQLQEYVGPTQNIELLSSKESVYSEFFNDPLWVKEWYLLDYRKTEGPVMDHNVVPVYEMGITGKGVTVAVVDVAIDLTHPDLRKNINIEKSFDVCSNRPMKEVINRIKVNGNHGTECAGLIGMVANNTKCGVGIAYNAEIAAIRHDCEGLTHSDKATALIANYESIDISSNSWGPDDDPSQIGAIEEIMHKAYIKGATKGRQGKGIIYIHSSGNGGLKGDNCAMDGVINHPYVIAITSSNQHGKKSSFSESCAANFATTYSGDWRVKQPYIESTITLMAGGECTGFSGTSASCAIASGIMALVLEANPKLTYRDMMHIITRSAEVAPLANNEGWQMNGFGFWVSNEFGFGLMNAENMVKLAQHWTNVPERHTCDFAIPLKKPEVLSNGKKVSLTFETNACQQSQFDSVFYMEHLEIASYITDIVRGKIKLSITSPSGTKTVLLEPRDQDVYPNGLQGWSIMSVQNWGENPNGKWIIDIELKESTIEEPIHGLVKYLYIKFHGIGKRRPLSLVKRRYSAFRLPNGNTELGGKY